MFLQYVLGLINAVRLKSRCSGVAPCLPCLQHSLPGRLSSGQRQPGKPLAESSFAAEQPLHPSPRLASSSPAVTQAEPMSESCWVWVPMPAASHTCQSLPSLQVGDTRGLLGSPAPLSKLYHSPWMPQGRGSEKHQNDSSVWCKDLGACTFSCSFYLSIGPGML